MSSSDSEKVLVIDLDKTCDNQKLLDGEPRTRGMRSGRVYLEPGRACGQHSTKDREELLVFLSGRSLPCFLGRFWSLPRCCRACLVRCRDPLDFEQVALFEGTAFS